MVGGGRVRSGRSVRPRASPVAGVSRLDTSVVSSVSCGPGLSAFGHFYHAKTSGKNTLSKQEKTIFAFALISDAGPSETVTLGWKTEDPTLCLTALVCTIN